MSKIGKNIVATLAYFDIFNYPLTGDEIYLFLPCKYPRNEFDEAISSLSDSRAIYHFDSFYSLKNDYSLVLRRYNGNKKAAELIKVAEKVSDLLIKFPYVRGIAVSGSLSKNFADENSDIDLFIITAKNKLWIARTLMHAFKKLTFLLNKQDYFCMNYYIDEQQLEIVEKTIYTAIEIVTLIPLQGDKTFERFSSANNWTRHYLPNKIIRTAGANPLHNSCFKRMVEKAFDNALGEAIDNLFMKITAGRWLKKTISGKRNSKGSVMALDVNKHYAKPDPKNFQDKLLNQYEHNLALIFSGTPNSMAR